MDDFVPDIKPEDYSRMIKSDWTVTPEDIHPPIKTVDAIGNSLLIQEAVVATVPKVMDGFLPTME